MNLEEANKKYLDLKKKLEKTREEVERLEVEVADLAADKAIAENLESKARRAGNTAEANQHKREAKEAAEKLKEAQEDAKNKKDSLKSIQEEIDKKVESIKEMPGMKEHFDEVMKKRTERQYFQNRKKLEELTEKKEKLETIQKLALEHTSLANNLTGMLVASKQLKEYEAELDSLVDDPTATPRTYTNPARAAEINNRLIPAARTKMADNKGTFLKYCEKHKVKVEEKDIQDILNGRVIEDPNGNIDLKTTLNARVGSVNRQIKATNKTMDNYAILGQSIQEEELAREEEERARQEGEKPKPWQLIKRFKNWLARRRQARLADEFERDDDDEREETGETTENEDQNREEQTRNEFRDSLKFDIVKDAMNQTMKDKIAEARREMEARRSEEQPEQPEQEDDREP